MAWIVVALLVGLAAEEARDLPAAGVLEVAELLAADGQQRLDRHVADLAGWGDHLERGREHRVGRRIVGQHAHEMEAELVDHRRVLLGGCVHLDALAQREGPVGGIGLGRIGEVIRGLLVEGRFGGSTEHSGALRVGHRRRLLRVSGERVPARRLLAVEAEGLRHVVDGGLALVGEVGVLRDPEEAASDEPGQRGAIFLLCDLGQLLAEGVEARIVERRGQGDGDGLVGLGCRRALRRLRPHACSYGRECGPRQRKGHENGGGETCLSHRECSKIFRMHRSAGITSDLRRGPPHATPNPMISRQV